MAAYLAMDIDLPDKPQFVKISELTGLPDSCICGTLYLFWRWVNAVAEPDPDRPGFGLLPGLTWQSAAKKAGGDEKFWRAVELAEWVFFKPEGIVIPGYNERFSPEAKRRWQDAAKKREHRESLRSGGFLPIETGLTANPPKKRRQYSETSVFEKLTPRDLQDVKFLMAWVTTSATKPNPVVQDDDYHRERTLAAARYCLTAPSVKNPVALFQNMHVRNLWTGLSEEYKEWGRSQFAQWAGRQQGKTGHPDLDATHEEDEPTQISSLGADFRKLINRGRN